MTSSSTRRPGVALLRGAALALALLTTQAACPGDLALPGDGGGGGWPDAPADDSNSLVWPDTMQVYTEGGLPDASDAAATPDGPATPDQTVQPDTDPPGVGGACPCTAPLICVLSACRAQCTAPTDACKSNSNCPTTHGCIPLNNGQYHVCIPAVATGGTCSATSFCAVKHVCGSVNGGVYTCLPTCSAAGAACGTGGVCLGSGCLFCSKP